MAKHPEPATVTSSAREIFLRAMESDDPEARSTLVDSACGDDVAVRGAVEALLHESEQIGDFLQSPAVATLREPPKVGLPSQLANIREASGDTIGPFTLLDLLGEGGCGMVYAAEQSAPVRRTVALKIIKLGMDTKSVIARFESERQALAMMEHPNIAKVFDAGATDTGRPYFVMELVRGKPITDFCDQQRLPTKQRLRLFIKVCNAIQHAHQKGIIHRDIKPSNILITDHDGTAEPKVIDFGIAKATEQRLTEHTLFTSIEAFIGTPTYMSPEQAEIGGTDIDTRSDIYSLGVLLYELLVGQTPFDAAELRRLPLDELRRTIREVEPERPSQKLAGLDEGTVTRIAENHATEPARLAATLRGDLDWIIVKCLEKERGRRYATVGGLVADIERHLGAQPVLARPPSTLYRAKKLMHRHGASIAAGAVLLVTLLAGIIISTAQAIRARDAEQEAREGKAVQEQLAALATREREIAERNAAAASLNEYVADINLTHLALSEGNFGRARQLLEKHRPSSGEPDRCGFEWRYLAKLSLGDEHVALPNQGGSVLCLAYSPDGLTLAVGLRDEVRLWNLPQRRQITSLPGGASSLLFLRDGHTLVSTDRDSNTTWVVDTSTWVAVKELRGHSGPLALSPDGSQLATGSRDGIHIWDTTDWFELLRLPDAAPGPRAFSSDGTVIAAPGRQGITLWSLSDGRPLTVLDDSARLFDDGDGGTLTFSADGTELIAPRNSPSGRGVFVLSTWDASTGKETGILQSQPGHTGAINMVSLERRSNLLASASLDHSVGLWDLGAKAAITQLSGHRSEVWCVAVAPDGRTVASGSKDGDIHLWPTSAPPARDTIAGSLVPLTFSQDSRRLAAVGADTTLTIYALPGLAATRSMPGAAIAALDAGLDVLALAAADGRVEIVDTTTLGRREIRASGQALDFLELSPDGTVLLSHARREELRWWDLREPAKPPTTLDAQAASISADGAVMATFAAAGDRVEIWDLRSRRLIRALDVPQAFGFSAAISPDGTRLATSAGFSESDNLVSLWDTGSGALIGSCAGHKQSVRSIAFTPDGRTLATASSDGSVKLWNVATQQELLSIRRLGSSLRHLRFSPDGEWLVGGSASDASEGELRLFHAPHDAYPSLPGK